MKHPGFPVQGGPGPGSEGGGIRGLAVLEVRGGLGGWTRTVAEEGREKNADGRSIWEMDAQTW